MTACCTFRRRDPNTMSNRQVLNLLIWHTGSSGAIPLGAFFSLVSLWFIVSIPLCYSGLLAGFCYSDRLRSKQISLKHVIFPWDSQGTMPVPTGNRISNLPSCQQAVPSSSPKEARPVLHDEASS